MSFHSLLLAMLATPASQAGVASLAVEDYLPAIDHPIGSLEVVRSISLLDNGPAELSRFLDIIGTHAPGAPGADIEYRIYRGSDPSTPVSSLSWQYPTNPSLPTYNSSLLCLVRVPGAELITVLSSVTGQIELLDTVNGAPQGVLVLPPGALWFNHLSNAGDLDGDGWDEILYCADNSSTVYIGVFDGQTLSSSWLTSSGPAYSWAPTGKSFLSSPADLDGDGVDDVTFSFVKAGATIFQPELRIMTLSGASGTTIWERDIAMQASSTVTPQVSQCMVGNDVTLDGIRDIGFSTLDSIGVIDGASGTTVWQVPLASLVATLPPNATPIITPRIPLYWDCVPGSPSSTTLCIVEEVLGVGQAASSNYRVRRFDGAIGTELSPLDMPVNLEPWSSLDPEGPTPAVFNEFFYLGDIDADGFAELSKTIPIPFGSTGFFINGRAILGVRSLSVPNTASIGSVLSVSLSIPGRPYSAFRLVFSSGFASNGGLRLGSWCTFLSDSPALRLAIGAGPSLSGTLDQNGDCTVQLPVPQSPSLVGRTFYWRAGALVAGTQPSIATMSNLAATLITL